MESIRKSKKPKKIIEQVSKPLATFTPIINKMRSYTEGENAIENCKIVFLSPVKDYLIMFVNLVQINQINIYLGQSNLEQRSSFKNSNRALVNSFRTQNSK